MREREGKTVQCVFYNTFTEFLGITLHLYWQKYKSSSNNMKSHLQKLNQGYIIYLFKYKDEIIISICATQIHDIKFKLDEEVLFKNTYSCVSCRT